MAGFCWNAEKCVLYALPTEKFSHEHKVVVESRILDMIAYEHDLIGHISMDVTWKAVEEYYYGIVHGEVRELVKKC